MSWNILIKANQNVELGLPLFAGRYTEVVKSTISEAFKFITAWKVSEFGVFLVSIFPQLDSTYSVRMPEKTDLKNSEYEQFFSSVSDNMKNHWKFCLRKLVKWESFAS